MAAREHEFPFSPLPKSEVFTKGDERAIWRPSLAPLAVRFTQNRDKREREEYKDKDQSPRIIKR